MRSKMRLDIKFLVIFAPDIHKGCLTIRLRLYPLNRIRVMPRPGLCYNLTYPLFLFF